MTMVNNVVRALYCGNWLTIVVRLRVLLSMSAGYALMQLVMLGIIKPLWIARRQKQICVVGE